MDGDGLVETARALLATGPLCDACLGRPVADRSHGLTNAERGRALRIAIALEDDEPIDDGDSAAGAAGDAAACWVCEGACARFDEWAERAAVELDGIDFDTYQVGTRVPPLIEENERLLREEAGLDPGAGEPINRECNREVGKRLGTHLDDVAVDRERPDVVALLDLNDETVDVRVNPAFVYGRYRKLERDIPQTRWPCRECDGAGQVIRDGAAVECEHCDGVGKLYETSVEEIVAPPVRDAMDGDEATFHGAGREDVDARMLGNGRPFVVEVDHPRVRRPDLGVIADAIDDRAAGRVAVSALQHATHELVERVKELDARKRYRALIRFDDRVDHDDLTEALAALAGATIEQRTPQRVDHRRADLVRERTVYEADGELGIAPAFDDAAVREGEAADGAEQLATVEFETEGGLYVKELVSGDDGRSDPSLAGRLDVDVSVVALDVLAVEGEEAPFEDPTYFLEPVD